MKRVKMVLAYDGTNYCGWQLQSNGITIEEVVNKALSELLKEPIAVVGASRTDSGVHSEGNVAIFDTETPMAADRICFALNQRLPEDIRVLSSEEVSLDWHPRKQNCAKTYEYRILNRKIPMPTLRLYSHFCYFPLDVYQMKRAASYLEGEHDFKSFCTARSQAEDTIRTIYSITVGKAGDLITIRVRGSGFLYNMVRIIAGTLIKVGMGVYPPEYIEEILDARNRKAAGPTAPARGLTLVGLEYETELTKKITGKNKDWEYQLIQTEIPEKKKAYLFVNRCRQEDFDRLVTRVTHQAVRNGARWVYVCDKEKDGRIVEGKAYGYYTFCHGHDMITMRKTVEDQRHGETDQWGTEKIQGLSKEAQGKWEKVDLRQVSLFCKIYNQIFYSVPNSATLIEAEVKDFLANDKWHLFFVKLEGWPAGFLILVEKERELEINSLGVLEEYRGRGLGREMLGWAEKNALEMGKEFLCLGVSSINKKALSLYEGAGFLKDGISSRWYVTEGEIPEEKAENEKR